MDFEMINEYIAKLDGLFNLEEDEAAKKEIRRRKENIVNVLNKFLVTAQSWGITKVKVGANELTLSQVTHQANKLGEMLHKAERGLTESIITSINYLIYEIMRAIYKNIREPFKNPVGKFVSPNVKINLANKLIQDISALRPGRLSNTDKEEIISSLKTLLDLGIRAGVEDVTDPSGDAISLETIFVRLGELDGTLMSDISTDRMGTLMNYMEQILIEIKKILEATGGVEVPKSLIDPFKSLNNPL